MDALSKISGFSRKNVEDYTSLKDIITDVETMTHDTFLQAQIVEVIERYLKKKSPNLLAGLEKPSEQVSTRGSIGTTGRSLSLSASHESTSHTFTLTRTSTTSSPAPTSRSILHSSFTTHKINILFRMEMVEREIEECKITMDKLYKRFNSASFLLQTEEDNLRTDIKMLQEDKIYLENFIADNTDKKTGRLLHEQFLRFLENEQQTKDRELRKMRLKTRTFQSEYNRMKSQQQQKLELRERLHLVDLEKLVIENQEQLQILEQKTKQLLELKKLVGKKGQNLVSTKSKLNDTIINLRNVNQDIKEKEIKYSTTENREIQNKNDLVAAEVLYQSIKKLNNTFKSPDVHTYLKMEATLSELRKEKDIWERRCKNKKQTTLLLEFQIKQMGTSISRSQSLMKAVRSVRSALSCKSAESLLKRRLTFPHSTPTTP